MSDNEQIEKALEKWVKVCPFSRSEPAKQKAYVAGYEDGVKAEHERLAGVCEWARTLIGSVSYLSNGCTGRGVQLSRFCPDCGKKVEVKE